MKFVQKNMPRLVTVINAMAERGFVLSLLKIYHHPTSIHITPEQTLALTESTCGFNSIRFTSKDRTLSVCNIDYSIMVEEVVNGCLEGNATTKEIADFLTEKISSAS